MSGAEISAVSAIDSALAPEVERSPANFGNWYVRELADANSAIHTAQTELKALAAGQTDNVHQVMLALEQASLSFQLTAQVRNKVLEAYQEMMRMQI